MANIAIIATAIINSINVKPRELFMAFLDADTKVLRIKRAKKETPPKRGFPVSTKN